MLFAQHTGCTPFMFSVSFCFWNTCHKLHTWLKLHYLCINAPILDCCWIQLTKSFYIWFIFWHCIKSKYVAQLGRASYVLLFTLNSVLIGLLKIYLGRLSQIAASFMLVLSTHLLACTIMGTVSSCHVRPHTEFHNNITDTIPIIIVIAKLPA